MDGSPLSCAYVLSGRESGALMVPVEVREVVVKLSAECPAPLTSPWIKRRASAIVIG